MLFRSTTLEAGVPNSDFDFWVGAFVAKKTPREIVSRIHREVVRSLNSPVTREKLTKLGVEPLIMTPEDFDARVVKELEIAKQLAKAANIQPQ